MRSVRLALAGLGLLGAACAREDRTALVADSVQLADSVALVVPAAPGVAAAVPRTGTAGARLAPKTETVVTVTEDVPGLLAEAKIHPLDAQHLAQTKYPKGKVLGGQIARGPAGLVYTFTIQQPDVEGVEEVLVSAMDGGIINTIHRDRP